MLTLDHVLSEEGPTGTRRYCFRPYIPEQVWRDEEDAQRIVDWLNWNGETYATDVVLTSQLLNLAHAIDALKERVAELEDA